MRFSCGESDQLLRVVHNTPRRRKGKLNAHMSHIRHSVHIFGNMKRVNSCLTCYRNTEVTEVDLSAFIYRLCHEHFSSILRINPVLQYSIEHSTVWFQNTFEWYDWLQDSALLTLSIEHSTTCDSRTHLNYMLQICCALIDYRISVLNPLESRGHIITSEGAIT